MLLVNGCSFTHGEELDGWEDGEHFPQTYGNILAEKLGTHCLNLAMGGSGNERILRTTINYLTNPTEGIPTHMVIMWSDPQRREVPVKEFEYRRSHYLMKKHNKEHIREEELYSYNGNQGYTFRMHWDWKNKPSFVEQLNYFFPPEKVLLDLLNYMQIIQLVCKQMKIKLIQTTFNHRSAEDGKKLLTLLRKELTKPREDYIRYYESVLKSLDLPSRWWYRTENYDKNIAYAMQAYGWCSGIHPSKEAHAWFAEILHEKFKEFYDVS